MAANPSALHATLAGRRGPGCIGRLVPNLRSTAATLFWTPDASSVFAYSRIWGRALCAERRGPVCFILGIGALLLNLDRLIGWCLLTWLGCALLLSSVLSAGRALLAAAAAPAAGCWHHHRLCARPHGSALGAGKPRSGQYRRGFLGRGAAHRRRRAVLDRLLRVCRRRRRPGQLHGPRPGSPLAPCCGRTRFVDA